MCIRDSLYGIVMKKILSCFFKLLSLWLIIISSNCLVGQQWIPLNGPNASYVPKIAKSSDGVLYAGADGGRIFKSIDNAGKWIDITNNFPNKNVIGMAVKPTGEIYLGCYQSIYVSRDKGVTWENSLDSFSYQNVYCFAFLGDTILAGTMSGIMLSPDNGKSWSKLKNQFSNNYILSLLVSGDTIFAGSSGVGLYYSFNRCVSWQKNNNLEDGISFTGIVKSTFGSLVMSSSNGVYFSNDEGINWKLQNTGLNDTNLFNIIVHPDGDIFISTMNSGVYTSNDKGNNWYKVNYGITQGVITRDFCFDINNNLIVSTGIGFFKSSNEGKNWFICNIGLNCTNVKCLAFDESQNYLTGTSNLGFFKSTDSGYSWILPDTNIIAKEVTCLLPMHNGYIFAGITDNGVSMSSDYGKTWKVKNKGIKENNSYPHIYSLAAGSTGEIYAGTIGLFKTTDNGENWLQVSDTLINHTDVFDIHFDSNSNIFLATTNGIIKSTDNGNSWEKLQIDYYFLPIKVITSGNNIFIATWDKSVLYSYDYGKTWQQSKTEIRELLSICINPTGIIYISTAQDGVYFSNDSAAKFYSFNTGLPNLIENFIIFTSDRKLVAGVQNYGLYISEEPNGVIDNKRIENNLSVFLNPTNQNLNIRYMISNGCTVKLSLFDILGQRVSALVNQWQESGEHNFELNINNFEITNGVYFLNLIANEKISSCKVIFIK